MRIEVVHPTRSQSYAAWRCLEGCPPEWHVARSVDEATRQGLEHATSEHGTSDVWFRPSNGSGE